MEVEGPLRSIFSVNGTRQVVTLHEDRISWVPFTPPSSFPPIAALASSSSAAASSASAAATTTLLLKDVCVLTRSGPRSFALHCLCVHDKDPALPRVYTKHDFALVGAYGHFPAPPTVPGEEPCAGWCNEVRAAIKRVNGDASTRKPVLVLINPFSGTKKGPQIWASECAPLFEAAGLRAEVVETQKAGEAYERVRLLPLGTYSAVATVGGDGILSEAVNGLMARQDWAEAVRTTPVAPIAAGTGNATTHSLYLTLSATTAACHLIKNSLRRADIFLAAQPTLQQFIWGVLDCGYGIVAEADFGSERIRWLGSMRTSVWAFYRILCGSMYRARLTYLSTEQPRQSWYGVRCARDCPYCKAALRRCDKDPAAQDDFIDQPAGASQPQPVQQQQQQSQQSTEAMSVASSAGSSPRPTQERDYDGDTEDDEPMESQDNDRAAMQPLLQQQQQQAVYGPGFTMSLTHSDNWTDGVPAPYTGLFSSYPHHKIGEPLPPGWAVHDNLSISFCTFMKLPWLQPGMLVAPFAHMADGCMDVAYATSEAFSRMSFIKFFGSFADGGHITCPKLSYLKVKSFTLEPLDSDGYIGIDGERVQFAPTQFHVAQGLLNFVCYC